MTYSFGIYEPEEGRKKDSDKFYNILQKLMRRKNRINYILGDLNAKTRGEGVKEVTSTFQENIVNRNGKRLMDFCSFNNCRIMNGFFKHKRQHRITWSARNSESIIDYIIASEEAKKTVLDVRSYGGDNVGTDHHLVKGKIRFKPWKAIDK